MANKVNQFKLQKAWMEFALNSVKVKPIHHGLYFIILERFNSLGWKENIGLPTGFVMEIAGIKNVHTYTKALYELIDFGFIKLIKKAKNQWTSNIIALSKIDIARDTAEELPCQKSTQHVTQHVTQHGHHNKTNKTINNKTKDNKHFADSNESTISYKKIYKHYLSKPNLIKHRKFTPEIRNAMKLAEKRLKLSENDFIKIIDRHSEIVEESKHETKYQVRARPIAELFGQKVYQGTALICSEYLDDGSKWLRHSTGSSETGFDTGGLKFAN